MRPEVELDMHFSDYPDGRKDIRVRLTVGNFSLDHQCFTEKQAADFVGEMAKLLRRLGIAEAFREMSRLLYPPKIAKTPLTNGQRGIKQVGRCS